MESFDTNTDHFGARIPYHQTLSLFKLESDDLFSLLQQKKLKMSKMNFNTKVKICKIQGTGYLIAKIHEGLK